MFRTAEDRIKSGNVKQIDLVSTHRINAFIYMIITILASLELLVPLVIIYRLQQTTSIAAMPLVGYYQILTIFISTIFFSASSAIFSSVQRKEVFTTTAAYCAVLVVFLGNANNAMVAPSVGVDQSAT